MRPLEELLKRDVAMLAQFPTYPEVAERCTRQMVRSGVLQKLAKQPDVQALNIESVAFLFDNAADLIQDLMVIVAKAYGEMGIPVTVLCDVNKMQAEEASKFGMVGEDEGKTEEEKEEEECQSKLSEEQRNKLLN
jgi:hypothetical protein